MFRIEIYVPPSRAQAMGQVLAAVRRTRLWDERARTLTFSSIFDVWRWWEEFSLVVWASQKWAGFLVRIRGEMLLPYRNDFYYNLQSVKQCWYNCQKGRRAGYCSGPASWGCHKLRAIMRQPIPGTWPHTHWYAFGRFATEMVWEVDRPAILRTLEAEAEDIFADQCPAFDRERLVAAVDGLPGMLDINEYWQVDYRLEITPKGPVQVPVGIKYDFGVMPDDEPPVMDTRLVREIGEVTMPGPDATQADIDEYLDGLLKRKKRGG